MKTRGGGDRDSFTLSLTSALDEGVVVKATSRSLYPREKDPVPTVQEAGWAPGPVWTGAENNEELPQCIYLRFV